MINSIVEALIDMRDVFEQFSEVYVFGSTTYSDSPNDLDLLLVYERITVEQAIVAKNRLVHVLETRFECVNRIDVTMFEKIELDRSSFLSVTTNIRIK